MFFAPRALYLASDGKTIVEANDERAATVLLGNGSPCQQHFSDRHGIAAYLEKHPEAPKVKAINRPPKDKAVKPSSNKSKSDADDSENDPNEKGDE